MPPTDTYIQGALSTSDVSTDMQPGEWEANIHNIIPAGKAPFAAMMMAVGRQPVQSKNFHWTQQAFPEQRGTISAITTTPGGSAYASGGVQGTPLWLTMSEADAKQIVPTHTIILMDPVTGSEFVAQVDQVMYRPGGTAWIGINMREADNGANDLADVTSFWLMTQVQAEGGNTPKAMTRQPVWYDNITTICSMATGMTGTQMVEMSRLSPNERTRQRVDGALRSAVEMEKSMLFSKRDIRYVGNEEVRFTQGVVPAIVANSPGNVFNHVTDTDTFLTTWVASGWYFLMQKLEILFRYTETGRKQALIGSLGLAAIGTAVEAKAGAGIQLVTRQSSFGFAITTLVTPFGELDLILDPLFTTHPQRRRSMLVFEVPLIKYCPLQGREWKFLPSIHDPNTHFGPDLQVEGWRGEYGVKYLNTDALGWFVNLGMDNV